MTNDRRLSCLTILTLVIEQYFGALCSLPDQIRPLMARSNWISLLSFEIFYANNNCTLVLLCIYGSSLLLEVSSCHICTTKQVCKSCLHKNFKWQQAFNPTFPLVDEFDLVVDTGQHWKVACSFTEMAVFTALNATCSLVVV